MLSPGASQNADAVLTDIVNKAGAAYSEGRYEEALQLYEKAKLSHPTNGVVFANLSAILLRLNRCAEALSNAETAVRLTPGWAKAYYRCGEAHRRLGSHLKALLSLGQAVSIDSSNLHMLNVLVQVSEEYFGDLFPLDALQRLNLQSDRCAVLSTIGQLLLQKNLISEGVQILNWSDSLDAPSLKIKESILSSLANAKYRQKEFRRAVDYYEQHLEVTKELGGDPAPIHNNISISASQCSMYKLALLHKQQQIAHNQQPADDADYLRVAELMFAAKMPAEAVEIFERLRRTSSSEEVAVRATVGEGMCLAAQGHFDSALRTFEGLSVSDPSLRLSIVECKNRCLIAEGRTDLAVEMVSQEMSRTNGEPMDSKMLCTFFCLLCEDNLILGHVAQSEVLARRMLKLARADKLEEEEARAYLLLSRVFEERKDIPSTVALLIKYTQMNVPNEQIALAFSRIANLLSDEEQIEQSLLKALKMANKSEDIDLRIKLHSQLHRFYKKSAQVGKAHEQLELEKALLSEDLSAEVKSIVYEDVGDALAEQGHSGEQLEVLEAGLAEAQEANNPRRESECCEKLALGMESLGRITEAEAYFEQQIAIGRQLRCARILANGFANMTRMHFRQQNWDKVVLHSRSALAFARMVSDTQQRIEMLKLMAEGEIKRNNLELAKVVVQKAIRVCELDGKRDDLARALRLAAEICMQLGQTKQSERYIQQHFALFDGVNNCVERSHCLLSLAELKGREGVPAASLQMVQSTLGMVHEVGEEEEKVALFLRAARICRQIDCMDQSINLLTKSNVLGATFADNLFRELEHYPTCRVLFIIIHLLNSSSLHNSSRIRLCSRISQIWPQITLKHLKIIDRSTLSFEEELAIDLITRDVRLRCEDGKCEDFSETQPNLDGLTISRLLNLLHLSSLSELQSLLLWNRARLSSKRNRPLYQSFWIDVPDSDLCSILDHFDAYNQAESRVLHSFDMRVRAHYQISKGMFTFDEIEGQLPLLDRILICALRGENIHIQKLLENLLSIHTSEKEEFKGFGLSPSDSLRYAAAFCALLIPLERQVLLIEETTSILYYEANKYSTTSADTVGLKEYFFTCGAYQLVWTFEDIGSPKLSYRYTGKQDHSCRFYDNLLGKLIENRPTVPSYRRSSQVTIAFGDVPSQLNYTTIRPLMSQLKDSGKLSDRQIASLAIGIGPFPSFESVTLSSFDYVALNKITHAQLLIWDIEPGFPSSALAHLTTAPRLCLLTGDVTFDIIAVLYAKGARCIAEVQRGNVDKIVDMLSQSQLPEALELITRIWGDPNLLTEMFSSPAANSLTRIRQILAGGPSSFGVFARAISEKNSEWSTETCERIKRIGNIMEELNSTDWNELSTFFSLKSTELINEIETALSEDTIEDCILKHNLPSHTVLHDDRFQQLYRLLYQDHLYEDATEEKCELFASPRKTPRRRRGRRVMVSPEDISESRRCFSDGEESLKDFPASLRRSARSLRGSATFIAVEEPDYDAV